MSNPIEMEESGYLESILDNNEAQTLLKIYRKQNIDPVNLKLALLGIYLDLEDWRIIRSKDQYWVIYNSIRKRSERQEFVLQRIIQYMEDFAPGLLVILDYVDQVGFTG